MTSDDWFRVAKLPKAVKRLDSGRVYPSVSEAARELGVETTIISQAASGRRKTVKGVRFEYSDFYSNAIKREGLVTPSAASSIYNIPRRTISRMISNEDLYSVKMQGITFIKESEIKEFARKDFKGRGTSALMFEIMYQQPHVEYEDYKEKINKTDRITMSVLRGGYKVIAPPRIPYSVSNVFQIVRDTLKVEDGLRPRDARLIRAKKVTAAILRIKYDLRLADICRNVGTVTNHSSIIHYLKCMDKDKIKFDKKLDRDWRLVKRYFGIREDFTYPKKSS